MAAAHLKLGQNELAIVDLFRKTVVGLHPDRVSQREAKMLWRNGTLTVIGPDGITVEHKLRSPKVMLARAGKKSRGTKRYRRKASAAFSAGERR